MMQQIILDTFFEVERDVIAGHKSTGLYTSVHSRLDLIMRARGFNCVGKGMYSTVWSDMHTGRMFKINSNINGMFDGFYAWMLACMEVRDNPALPKFGEMIQIGKRYCVEVIPMNTQSTIINAFDLFKYIKAHSYMAEAVLLSLKVAANCGKVWGGNMFNTYTPDDIKQSTIADWLDIHQGNLLEHNGHIVLNDPIARLDREIEFMGVDYENACAA